MRILLTSDVPLTHEVGAGRVQLEAAEELERAGHTVTTFGPADAFGPSGQQSLRKLRPLAFARRARAFVREHGGEFDVIDALQTCLPYSKQDLRFSGRLVSRSIGLTPLYARYLREERERWPDQIPGTALGQRLRRWSDDRLLAASLRSYAFSDVVRVLNDDEREYVTTELGLGDKVVQLPEALPDAHLDALAAAAGDSASRLASCEVSVVGSWSLRKGAADWPAIVARVRAELPQASFSFLGTGCGAKRIYDVLGTSERIRVVPEFASSQLPELLRHSTAGALPSYVEGYGLGVVEQLAAGLPTVAYDAPGPRTILREASDRLTPRGDASLFADRVVTVLRSRVADYDEQRSVSTLLASRHRLSASITQLTRMYGGEPGRPSSRRQQAVLAQKP